MSYDNPNQCGRYEPEPERTWHRIEKFYKGGCSKFQIATPKGIRLSRAEWEGILEWLGENTSGGHNYGYSIYRYPLKKQSKTLRIVRYPSHLSAKLMGYGTEVVTTRMMI